MGAKANRHWKRIFQTGGGGGGCGGQSKSPLEQDLPDRRPYCIINTDCLCYTFETRLMRNTKTDFVFITRPEDILINILPGRSNLKKRMRKSSAHKRPACVSQTHISGQSNEGCYFFAGGGGGGE